MNENHTGRVKFYSKEKGYGFIYDDVSATDIYFRIRSVQGAYPPEAGDVVTFAVVPGKRTGQIEAQHIAIHERAIDKVTATPKKQLQGFPCIRGDSIGGFEVVQRLGRVNTGHGFFSLTYWSANDARDVLIEAARSKGANAIFNFVWHNDRQRQEYLFFKGSYMQDNFWAEGDAVVLAPK